jgi:hypothetical protein
VGDEIVDDVGASCTKVRIVVTLFPTLQVETRPRNMEGLAPVRTEAQTGAPGRVGFGGTICRFGALLIRRCVLGRRDGITDEVVNGMASPVSRTLWVNTPAFVVRTDRGFYRPRSAMGVRTDQKELVTVKRPAVPGVLAPPSRLVTTMWYVSRAVKPNGAVTTTGMFDLNCARPEPHSKCCGKAIDCPAVGDLAARAGDDEVVEILLVEVEARKICALGNSRASRRR